MTRAEGRITYGHLGRTSLFHNVYVIVTVAKENVQLSAKIAMYMARQKSNRYNLLQITHQQSKLIL